MADIAQGGGAAPKLDELMLAMDVVDTLRHQEGLVEKALGEDSRDATLKERLRALYEGQGLKVSDRILDDGIRALKAGAMAYLNKAADPQTIVKAVRTVATGRKYVTPEIAQALADNVTTRSGIAHDQLSDREMQTLVLIAEGHKLSEIAERLSLSPKTVSVYRARVLEKLKLSSNAELATYAMRNKLIDLGPVD